MRDLPRVVKFIEKVEQQLPSSEGGVIGSCVISMESQFARSAHNTAALMTCLELTECWESEAGCLLKLGQKSPCSFYLVLSGHVLWGKPATM